MLKSAQPEEVPSEEGHLEIYRVELCGLQIKYLFFNYIID